MKKFEMALLVPAVLSILAGRSAAIEIDPTKFYSVANSAASTALWTIDPTDVTGGKVAMQNVLSLHLEGGGTPDFMTNTIAFSPSNVLYGWDTGSKRLYTIDLASGQIDYVGSPTVNSGLDTQWINGMAFIRTQTGAELYGLSGATNNLYRISTNDGGATLVAHIPETVADIFNVGMGVNFRTNELYAVSGVKDTYSDILLKINPGGTPIAQVIGNLGVDYNDVSAEFDENGNLYTVRDRNRMFLVDLGNGQATWIGDLGTGYGPDGTFQSTNLAHPWPDTAPVPEPGTLMLLGSGLAGLAAYGRKRMGG